MLFLRTERHVLHAHLLQAGDILFQELDLLLQLQREKPAHAVAMNARSLRRVVEHFKVAMAGAVHQRRKADQLLPALLDFQQLRQFAE
jgi:hypothetical protein